MRWDMAKVIVERPRHGSRDNLAPKGFRRSLQRMAPEDWPHREGMRQRWKSWRKWLNEHLGPLRRYLDSQVGRPWDDVFSEICAHINRNSAVQDHVRDHVQDYVAVHVYLVDGVPYSGAGWDIGRPVRNWYVCPRTGLLRRVEIRPRRKPNSPQPYRPPEFVRVSDDLQCHRIKGAWHLVTMKPLPLVRDRCEDRDVVLDVRVKDFTPSVARKHYGAEVYAVALRRLSYRELRQLPVPWDLWGGSER